MPPRTTAQPVQVPGDTTAQPVQGDEAVGAAGASVDDRIARLEAALAAQQAENERLKAEADGEAKLPSVVYEPTTPHGAARLRESETGNMTTAQVIAAIDAGKLPEPVNSYLCRDGYYARRTHRGG
jgi:hypothetical protein